MEGQGSKLLATLLHMCFQVGFSTILLGQNSLVLQINLSTPETKTVTAVTRGGWETLGTVDPALSSKPCLSPGTLRTPHCSHPPFLILPIGAQDSGNGILDWQQSKNCAHGGCRVRRQTEPLRRLVQKTQGVPPPLGKVSPCHLGSTGRRYAVQHFCRVFRAVTC